MIASFVGPSGRQLLRDTRVTAVPMGADRCPAVQMRAAYVDRVVWRIDGEALRAVWSPWPIVCRGAT